jgi:hypothetical protein
MVHAAATAKLRASKVPVGQRAEVMRDTMMEMLTEEEAAVAWLILEGGISHGVDMSEQHPKNQSSVNIGPDGTSVQKVTPEAAVSIALGAGHLKVGSNSATGPMVPGNMEQTVGALRDPPPPPKEEAPAKKEKSEVTETIKKEAVSLPFKIVGGVLGGLALIVALFYLRGCTPFAPQSASALPASTTAGSSSASHP